MCELGTLLRRKEGDEHDGEEDKPRLAGVETVHVFVYERHSFQGLAIGT